MSTRAIGFGSWGITAAVAIAVLGGTVWRLETRRESATEQAGLRAQEIARIEAERTRLEAERASRRAAAAQAAAAAAAIAPEITAAAVRKEALLSLVELKKNNRLTLLPGTAGGSAWSLERDGVPSRAFGEVFGLTATQLGELQAAIERVAELAAIHATMRRSATGGVIIDIAEAPEIESLRGELRGAFVRGLGEDGLAAYEGLRPGLASLFSLFGLGSRTIAIERRGAAYQINDATSGRGPNSSRAIGSTVTNRSALEARLGALARLLPDDF